MLEPSVPYPSETEIIANIVTSPHHLSATMVTGRVHRMTELFGRLAPGAISKRRAPNCAAIHGAIVQEHPESYPTQCRLPDRRRPAARSDHLARANRAAGAAGGVGADLHHRLLERGQPDPRPLGAARRRAGDSRGARRQRRALRRTLLAESLVLCGAGRDSRRAHRAADGRDPRALRRALLGARARSHGRLEPAAGWGSAWRSRPPCCSRSFRGSPRRTRRTGSVSSNGSVRITSGTNRRLRVFAVTQIAASFVLLAGAGMLLTTLIALQSAPTGFNTHNVLAINVPVMSYGANAGSSARLL